MTITVGATYLEIIDGAKKTTLPYPLKEIILDGDLVIVTGQDNESRILNYADAGESSASDFYDSIQAVAGMASPKIYRALLSQSGTAAPTAVILENTLGEVPTFSYSATGLYLLTTVSPVFVVDKTSPLPGSGVSGNQVGADRYDANTIEIYSFGETYIPADEILVKTPLIITIDP